MNLTNISDCELMVIKCLWDTGQPMTVPEIIERIKKVYGKAYKETTIYTFLKRLRDKKYVTSYKQGCSHFQPLITQEAFLEDYARRMVAFWGGARNQDIFCGRPQSFELHEPERE